MWSTLQIVLLVTVIITKTEGARILAVYPTPSISHQVAFRPLTLELVKRGHEVVVITTDSIFPKGEAPKNLTEIDLHDLSYQKWHDEFVSIGITQGNRKNFISQFKTMFKVGTKLVEMQLVTKEVQNLINDKSQKFDLLIHEACSLQGLVFSHIYKVPVIQISSFGTILDTLYITGAPSHPLLHPFPLSQKINNRSLWDKLTELYNRYEFDSIITEANVELTKGFRKILGQDMPEYSELKKNVDMVFLNVHSIWEMNRPAPPNMIYLGGLHQKPETELPKDLKAYLDSSKNGVIYISFGTNVEPALLPPHVLQALINVFSKLPYDVLWKWNRDELPGRTENIKISKWLPQSDLLRHPKIKMFITQAGLQSTDEAITAGVPLIAVPMLADQWYNAEQYVYHGIGEQLDLETLDEENFRGAIEKIANNDRITTETMWSTLQIVLLVTVIITKTEGARILAVYPTPSISHQVAFRPLTLELVKRGHEVVVITTDSIFPKGEAPKNLTEIDLHDLSYQKWHDEFVSIGITQGNRKNFISQFKTMFKVGTKLVEMQLVTKEVQNLINDKSQKFDLLIHEACSLQGLVFSHIYKVPVIQISSFGTILDTLYITGAPSHPLLHPFPLSQKINNRSLWDKLTELYNRYEFDSIITEANVELTKGFRKILGQDMPEYSELKKNVDMVFLNVHSIWEMNRPAPPNMIYLGGLHQKPETELPKDLKAYLDSSKNGVIYISFGTNVEPALLPPHVLQALINVFSKLPYDVLWKWNRDELPGRTENIKISKWLPQSDLLRHPKIKMFITQAGLQSTDEAITAGVPLIAVPMLADQWYNAEQYVYHGIGEQLDLETLDEENFRGAIEKIANNDSYRQNILRLRSIMHDQPESPLDRAVWWTEYVLRHGGAKHLRSPSANITWTEYLELELVFYLLALVASVLSLFVFIVLKLCRSDKISVKAKSL